MSAKIDCQCFGNDRGCKYGTINTKPRESDTDTDKTESDSNTETGTHSNYNHIHN